MPGTEPCRRFVTLSTQEDPQVDMELPDGKTVKQIDHILFNRIWRNSVKDVRVYVYRGADVGSDQSLAVTTIRLSLKENSRSRRNS